MSSVVIVGTKHTIQRDISHSGFRTYIEGLISQFGIKVIAEEIDVDSIPLYLAKKHNLQYINIEPNLEERAVLGIQNFNQIENSIFMEFDELNSKEAKIECEKRKREAYQRREKEWFKRVKSIQYEPILVVCGANHLESFSDLLEKAGFSVTKHCELWE
ncbi:hypothetical protein [Aeromonas taiwanensis]|uniref:hypothetical protein n=1 Tax=Aeromonas taiwanensis TaxID=633417 RepID=UPI001268E853|nr:hypothetical protein [Aeromonas taiwanensis]